MRQRYYKVDGQDVWIAFRCRAFQVSYYRFGILGHGGVEYEVVDASDAPEYKWREENNLLSGVTALQMLLADEAREWEAEKVIMRAKGIDI